MFKIKPNNRSGLAVVNEAWIAVRQLGWSSTRRLNIADAIMMYRTIHSASIHMVSEEIQIK